MKYDLTAYAVVGKTYVMSFSWSGVPAPTEALQSAISSLVGAFLKNPVIAQDGSLGGHLDVTFQTPYAQPFSTIAPLLISAFQIVAPDMSVDYIQSADAGEGLTSASACGVQNLSACFADVKSLGYLVIAVLVLIVVVKLN